MIFGKLRAAIRSDGVSLPRFWKKENDILGVSRKFSRLVLLCIRFDFIFDLLSIIDRQDTGTPLIFHHLVLRIAAGQRAFYYRGVKLVRT